MIRSCLSVRHLALLVALSTVASVGCSGAGAGDDAEALDQSAAALVGPTTFQNGVAPTASYQGTTDATLEQVASTTNFGGDTTVRSDLDYPNGSHKECNSLLRFDVGSIAAGRSVKAVHLTLTVTSPTSGEGYTLYALKRAWNESQTTWSRASSGAAWAAPGARGTSDRSSTALGKLLPTADGKYRIALDAAGIALVQQWIDHPSTNFGFVIDATTNEDGLTFASSEAATVTDRPQLSVTLADLPPPPPPSPIALQPLVTAAAPGSVLSLGTGTYDFRNFGSNNIGIDMSALGGVHGAGIGSTIIEMVPNSSTKAGSITGTTNPLTLMAVTGSPTVSGFTLLGTPQGHLYNGLRIHLTTNAHVSNVKIASVPGNDHVPPGETFGLNDWRTTGSSYANIEIDGAGVGASGFATNSSSDVVVSSSNFHDNPYSAGGAFWQTNNVTLTDVITTKNRTGLNFERVSGTVKVVRPVITGSTSQDLYVGSDQGSASYTISDPKLAAGTKLRVNVPVNYNGIPNKQKRSDIHVLVGGVDHTATLVQWL